MKDDEWLGDVALFQQLVGGFFRGLRQLQLDRTGGVGYSERRKEREMIIDRVHVPHSMRNEFVIEPCPEFRSHFDSKRDDPLFGAGKKHQESRAVVSGEIDAAIESAAGNSGRGSKSAKSAAHNPQAIHSGNCRSECFTFL